MFTSLNDPQAGTSATQQSQDDASETRGMHTQISGNPMGLSFVKKRPFSGNPLIILVNTQTSLRKAVQSNRGGRVCSYILIM